MDFFWEWTLPIGQRIYSQYIIDEARERERAQNIKWNKVCLVLLYIYIWALKSIIASRSIADVESISLTKFFFDALKWVEVSNNLRHCSKTDQYYDSVWFECVFGQVWCFSLSSICKNTTPRAHCTYVSRHKFEQMSAIDANNSSLWS